MALCDRLISQLACAQLESHRLVDAVLHEALRRALPFCDSAWTSELDGCESSYRVDKLEKRHGQAASVIEILELGERLNMGHHRIAPYSALCVTILELSLQ